ncbi:hypothetical protein B0I35DRAFT_465732 [Stachybotrys elegans]|uniref:Uncharacterized protein n=1 Tax=Stachybotrys elegans TaxID=80388 RepID=A0A8K0SDE9_9HYPO|nr:hypothetical protein B0I35DRAFT_465732 [Stachybotrys elegans]
MRAAKAAAQGLTCLLPLLSRNPQHPHSLIAREDQPVPDQDLDEIFPDEGNIVLEQAGLGNLTVTPSNVRRWEAGLIPQACAEISQDRELVAGNCSFDRLEVYNVTYEDCRQPWIFCRCHDADDNFQQVIEDFGRIPVASRELVRHVVLSDDYVTPTSNSSLEGVSLYWVGDLVIYGLWSTVALFVHEIAHNLDWHVRPEGSEVSYAETQEFIDVVENDTCVSDYYSKTSYSELYAQAAVMLAYEFNVGPVDELADDSCMSSTAAVMTEQLEDYLTYDPERTCSLQTKLEPSEVWCIRDGQAGPCESESNDDNNNEGGNGGGDSGSAAPRTFIGALPVLMLGTVLSIML